MHKIKPIAVIIFLLIASLLPVTTSMVYSSNVVKTSCQIPWGKMDAELSKEVMQISIYDMETVKMNISYKPYFIQFFPVWVDIHLVDAPAWLSVIISEPQFYLQPGEVKTISIYLKVNEDVENGTQGVIKFEIDGRNILLPSLLEIDSCYAFLVAIKIG